MKITYFDFVVDGKTYRVTKVWDERRIYLSTCYPLKGSIIRRIVNFIKDIQWKR